jgi:hypothetical protein
MSLPGTIVADATSAPRHQRGFFEFTAVEGFLVGVTSAIVQFGSAFVYGITPTQNDFPIFQQTTRRFLDGQRMYSAASVDFTPPLFHVFLLPLANLVPWVAFVIWTAVNMSAAWFVFRKVLRALPDARAHRWTIAAWVVNAAGVQMTLRLGQVSWLVALLVTSAWLSARSSRWVAAGAWTGAAVALKPFLLLAIPVFAVRRQWKALAMSIATVLGCCALSALLFGWPAFTDWIANLRQTPEPMYAMHFLNASWLALMARARLPYMLGSVLSIITIALMLWRVHSTNEDETWLLVSITALLVCPIGWVYYLPMLLGPAVAIGISGRYAGLRWVAPTCIVPCLSARFLQDGYAPLAITFGSIYFWGFLLAFVYIVTRRDRSRGTHLVELPITIRGILA